jgi:hypothetical protein
LKTGVLDAHDIAEALSDVRADGATKDVDGITGT